MDKPKADRRISDTVLYFYEGAFTLWRQRMVGICEEARKKGWRIQPVNVDIMTSNAKSVLDFWKPLGVIVDGGTLNRGGFAADSYAGIPAVFCDSDRMASGRETYCLRHDSESTARIAAKELLSLTSIAPDFERSGRLAVDLLARRMADGGKSPVTLFYGASPLVRRQSTRTVTVYDTRVVKALEYIRLNACSGATVADAVKTMGLKARTGENRFLAACGHSIRDEILDVRVREAKRLLADTDLPVALIAEKCGYGNERSLRYVFAKATGVSPIEWRRNS